MTITPPNVCQYCGKCHDFRCPEIKSIEYGPDGKITRVEFLTPADYPPLGNFPPLPVTFGVAETTWVPAGGDMVMPITRPVTLGYGKTK